MDVRAVDPETPQWRRSAPTEEQRRTDVLGAVGLFLLSVLSLALGSAIGTYGSPPASLLVSVAVLAAVTLPLAVRRRWPTHVLGVVTVAYIFVGELPVAESVIASVALFCALYTVGAWEPNRRLAVAARAVMVATMVVWLGLSVFRTSLAEVDEALPGDGIGALTPAMAYMLIQVLINVLYFAGGWWFGSHSWRSARERALVDYRTAQLQAEQAVVAGQALTIERLRIARELHDAVAHHVSLMGVQAAAARSLVSRDPRAAEDQLLALEDSARLAVAELYELLGTLREEPGSAVDETDAPTATLDLRALPQLVAEAGRAGLEVDLEVIGTEREVSGLVGLNLYRIAQEALTNVVKHAGTGTRTRVRVRYLSGRVELEITDDGRGRPMPPATGRSAGLGLVGMRERVSAMRGELTAQPRGAGGFVVRATVPDTVKEPTR